MKRWLHWVRLSLGITLVALLVTHFAGMHATWSAVLSAHPLPLAGCVAIYFVGVVLSCLKWQWLLRAQGIQTPLTRLVQWYLMGALAGTLLPSDVGGDLGRGYAAAREMGNGAAVWSSILMERFTGLIALAALAALALALMPGVLDAPAWLPLGAGIGVALSVVAFAVILGFSPVRLERLPHWLSHIILQFQEVAARYRNNAGTILACLGLSVVFHLGNALSFWWLALAIQPDAPAATMILWPLAGLFGVLPLTPGGLGVREGITAALLLRADLTSDQAVAAALIGRMLLLLCSLAGLPTLIATLSHVHERASTTSEKEFPNDVRI
ncbi:MAG: lysylphosphatidylglycerol synthase transmembrane domain-containing protein [Roseiflexaceae bacterium]|nr:lysylphosphatidylglycerol synthase transmembrane domain-containing protein [Roseiflexaceae bacterium]